MFSVCPFAHLSEAILDPGCFLKSEEKARVSRFMPNPNPSIMFPRGPERELDLLLEKEKEEEEKIKHSHSEFDATTGNTRPSH